MCTLARVVWSAKEDAGSPEAAEMTGTIIDEVIRVKRTPPAFFGAEYLLFGQVKLKYRELARLQYVPPAGVG